MNWLRGGSVTEYFAGIRDDLEKLSLAAYLADVARESTGEFVPAVDILRMTLNSIYAISRCKHENAVIKAVYEWRTAGYAGYMPDMNGCQKCRLASANTLFLDVMNGRLICSDCLNKTANIMSDGAMSAYEDTKFERNILVPMGQGAVEATKYALTALPERMFSFKITSESDRDDFCRAAETYLLNHLERNFDTLDFYKKII